MPSITTFDNLWDGAPPHHCLRASRLGRPIAPLSTLGPGLHTRNFSRESSSPLASAVGRSQRHPTYAYSPGPRWRPPARWSGKTPRLSVHVHKNGARHVMIPSKLLASAQRPLAQRLAATVSAKFLPVPAENLRILEGGENTYARLAQTRSRPYTGPCIASRQLFRSGRRRSPSWAIRRAWHIEGKFLRDAGHSSSGHRSGNLG